MKTLFLTYLYSTNGECWISTNFSFFFSRLAQIYLLWKLVFLLCSPIKEVTWWSSASRFVWKISQNSQENFFGESLLPNFRLVCFHNRVSGCRSATLLKRDYIKDVFLCILSSLSDQLLRRTPKNSYCFSWLIATILSQRRLYL